MQKCITGVFLFFLTQYNVHSQVWTQPEKGYYAQASFSTATFENAYDSTGASISLFPFQVEDLNIQLYGNYGVTEKLTTVLKIPYAVQKSIYVDSLNLSSDSLLQYREANISYFGNIEAGVIYKIRDKYPIVSASFFLESNTNDRNYAAGLASGFNAWSFKPGIGAAGVYKKMFYSAYTNLDIKTNQYSSGLIGMLEFGYTPAEIFFISGAISSRTSFQNSNYCPCNLTNTGIYINNQEYVSVSIKPGFYFNGAGLNFGYTTALTAKNTPAAGIFTVGFSYKKTN
ncbi:MAG: hypothetical protein ACKVPJ_04505 [Chitinophagales bacterium]